MELRGAERDSELLSGVCLDLAFLALQTLPSLKLKKAGWVAGVGFSHTLVSQAYRRMSSSIHLTAATTLGEGGAC